MSGFLDFSAFNIPASLWPSFGLSRQIGDTEEEELGGAGTPGGLHGGQGMHMDDDHDEHHGLDEASLKEHEEVTKVKVREEKGRRRRRSGHLPQYRGGTL